ncbi:MAG TPA: glycosyltransferase family 2 protein [Candidatus Limnocylindrales bacterium]|nr:glycosyltransferase family 2 protein [Candidatus Limnocylindrales bacterium]
MPDGATTPLAWRAAALATLVGGFAVGAAAAVGGGARWLVAGAVGVVVTFLVPILTASRRPPIPPDPAPLDPAAPPPTISVVVAGRDEAAVLPRLVADVAAQDHRDPDGAPRFELVVVDDRSEDGTAEAVHAAAEEHGIAAITTVIRREGPGLPDGKGAALTAAQPDRCRGDVVLVLDADARIGPGFLRRLAAYVAAGADAVTARRRILHPESSWLAGAQADEQNQDGELQRGRWASGGCSEFRGNGIALRRSLLASVGGWRASALTEDIDLASRIAAAHGTTVAWALDLEVWEEPVRTWSGLWRQRLRWSEGGVRRLLEHGPAVLTSPHLPLRARLDFGAYGLQLLAPPLILGAAAGAVSTGATGAAVGLVGTYLAAGGTLAFDALRWEAAPGGGPLPVAERLGRSVRAALFSAVWLGAIPGALWKLATRRGHVRYDKMPHVGMELPAGGTGEAAVAHVPGGRR